MRIHSSVLQEQHFRDAAKRAGVSIIKCDVKGSRSRAHAYDVALSGRGVNGGMYGNLGYPTATWDEWGMMLNHLFDVDPEAIVRRIYDSAEHFHWATGNRFTTLTPEYGEYRHRWERHGLASTRTYATMTCKRCDAINRWMMPGYTFAELTSA